MSETLCDIGSHIRKRRRDLGMRQEDVAKISGVPTRTVRNMENGNSRVRMGDVVTVVAVLGLSFDVHVRSLSVQQKFSIPHPTPAPLTGP